MSTDAWLRTEPGSEGREPPDVEGVERRDGEWRLRLEFHDSFIRDVTGIETTGGVSTRELKTIQSRLEGCVETYKREGACACEEFWRYDHLDSIDAVRELARFFRAIVASRIEAGE
ncbi:MAG: hypothetical protein ABEH66_04855 [Halobacteriales archaeon]